MSKPTACPLNTSPLHMTPFPEATPESMGIRSRDILSLLQAYNQNGPEEETHSLLLLRHGRLVFAGAYAPFSLRDRNTVFSCTKMLTGTAVGFAEAEGLLHLHDPVASYFPELLPPVPDPRVLRVTVEHLLTMTVGQKGEVVHEGKKGEPVPDDPAAAFFARACDVEPGTVFRYDGDASYLLSRLIKKVTGLSLFDYLTPRLFTPLGFPPPPHITDRDGTPIGWTGARLTLGELTRIGQLYLQKGVWEGRQVLPAGWTERASACHIPTSNATGEDWSVGYCYQFWRGRHNTFRFCGALGQMCVISPDTDSVFTVFSGFVGSAIHRELDAYYNHILTRMADRPLPPDPEGEAMLRCYALRMALPQHYAAPSPRMPEWEGATLPTGNPLYPSVTFRFAGDAVHLTLHGTQDVHFAAGLSGPLASPVFSRGLVALGSDFETIYSSTACFDRQDLLTVTTRVIGAPTLLYLRADFSAMRATLNTLRGNFDHP